MEEVEKLRGKVDLSELSKSRDATSRSFSYLRPEPIEALPVADIFEKIREAVAECGKLEEPLDSLSRKHDSKPKEATWRCRTALASGARRDEAPLKSRGISARQALMRGRWGSSWRWKSL